MKTMILGAEGQVGRALELAAPSGVCLSLYTHAELAIDDFPAVAEALADVEPALVINAAAFTDVDAAESQPDTAEMINARAPGQLAELCAKNRCQLIHFSTDYVFDGKQAEPYRPTDTPSPINVYGKTKAAGERAVQTYLPAVLILRTAWLYGQNGRNFVNTILRHMTTRAEVSVVDDQFGTPTHASSLARAVWSLVDQGATGIHHYTDNGAASWHEFAVAIADIAASLGLIKSCRVLPISTADYPTAAARPVRSVLDCTATWAITGKPPPWHEELAIMLAAKADAR
jgi:dTDP-4-dehydrorhamnose reductase